VLRHRTYKPRYREGEAAECTTRGTGEKKKEEKKRNRGKENRTEKEMFTEKKKQGNRELLTNCTDLRKERRGERGRDESIFGRKMNSVKKKRKRGTAGGEGGRGGGYYDH